MPNIICFIDQTLTTVYSSTFNGQHFGIRHTYIHIHLLDKNVVFNIHIKSIEYRSYIFIWKIVYKNINHSSIMSEAHDVGVLKNVLKL